MPLVARCDMFRGFIVLKGMSFTRLLRALQYVQSVYTKHVHLVHACKQPHTHTWGWVTSMVKYA